MLYFENNLIDFFNEKINLPNCNEKTRAYIISIFSDLKSENDLSKESVTLLYNTALTEYNFNKFREIGDWIFIAKSMFPNSLNNASPMYYTSIARSAYYKCYLIMNRQWFVFEELADRFHTLTDNVNESLAPTNDARHFNRLF